MQLYLNNFATTLLAPADADADQFSVPPDEAALLVGLDGANYYCLTAVLRDDLGREVAWEIIRVTSKSGGMLTVQRHQEGTTALNLEAGAELHLRLTAAALMTLQEQVKSLSERVSELETPEQPGADGVLLDASGNQLTDHMNNLLTGVSE
ncbi:hypothetical protein VUJ49_22680 [Pseudomonas berkeleyensis]|uniref:Uncharacterized protein n=1 Tax=Pseudomonas berkeleyensis TaxID=2726956 RepID=A0A7G5DM03_9PSED|nr:hypothetical protein [Pseudomonas berkeleyensis]QMV62778.1 hypothetical protein HS968_22585 [Pseudomonas berkeleyensis]WSO38228.1 hypothetical protein VUJ49_22680 [Pseudomonas berkeleyensis]